MYQNPFAKFTSVLSILASIIGVRFFFINPTITIICAVVTLFNSVVQTVCGDQNNLNTEIFTVVIAIIIALIAELSIFNIIGFALCIVETLMNIIGWIIMLVTTKKYF